MASRDELSPEVSRIVEYLELLIATKKIGIREIERRLDGSKGTLNRLFSGKVAIKLQTLFDILEVLGVRPEDFFSIVFSKDGSGSATDEMLRKVQSVALPHSTPLAVFTREEVTRLVEEVLLKAAKEKERQEVPAPPKRTRRPSPRSPRGAPKG